MGATKKTTDADFTSDVLQSDKPVLVDFWAEWCGPCHALAPVLEREIGSRGGAVELVKVDVDSNQNLASTYRVQGIPAVKGFKDSRVAGEFVGAQSPAAVSSFLDGLLAPPRIDGALEHLRACGGWIRAPGDVGAELRVLERRQRREQVEGLKHEADAVPAEGEQLLARCARDVLPVEGDPSLADPRGPLEQPQHGVAERGLARPGLADDADELAGAQRDQGELGRGEQTSNDQQHQDNEQVHPDAHEHRL